LEIQKVKQQDILNFKDWWPLYYKKKCLLEASYGRNVPKTQKVTFSISKYNQFIHSSKPILKNKINYSDFIDGLVFYKFSLRLPHQTAGNKMKLTTEVASKQKVPISVEKS
jgi:hypothetical protein